MPKIQITNNYIKCIIFDMDGVLIDSAPLTRSAAKKALAEIGIHATDNDFAPYIGTGEKNFIKGPCSIYKKQNLADSALNNFYRYFEELAACELKVFPSAVKLLNFLAKCPLKLAIASSSAKRKLIISLNSANISTDFFDVIISGDDVTERKPSPEIYMTAAQHLGINPQECLVVEDAVSGIKSAKSAGCQCFAVTTSFKKRFLKEAGADFTGDDLTEVLNVLQLKEI